MVIIGKIPVNNNKRVLYLDVAKCFTTFLVVFGHLYIGKSPERMWIYSFHMPLFFLISGFLHRYNGNIQIRKYFRTILFPAIFFLLLYDVVTIVPFHFGLISWAKNVHPGETILVSLQNVIQAKCHSFSYIKGNEICWFLISLFWCKVFVDIIERRILYGLLFVILVFVVSYMLNDPLVMMAQAVVALPFYWGGYKLYNSWNGLLFSSYSKYLFVLCLLLFVVLVPVNGKITMYHLKFGHLPMPLNTFVFYIVAILGSYIVLFLSGRIRCCQSGFELFAKSLISIVGLQKIFIKVYQDYIGFNSPFVISFLSTVLIVGLCFIGHIIILKYVPSVLGR